MHAGLDFGTSNNALSIQTDQQETQLIMLEGDSPLLPSAIYAAERDLVPLLVLNYLHGETREQYLAQRSADISRAKRLIVDEGLSGETLLHFGSDAFDAYMQNPAEGYFVKSPKSYLGVLGLQAPQLRLFEDLCILLIGEIKHRAEQQLGTSIQSLTIGRPVNFLGQDAEKSNTQALQIISDAAAKVGISRVEFRLEPAAAGYHFARSLKQPKRVLVADIGGGTSDFSLLELSANGQSKAFAHRGTRTGGNDFDIALAMSAIMPTFGLNESNNRGLPVPSHLFWEAMSVNNVAAQRSFYSADTAREIEQILIDMPAESRFAAFKSVWHDKRSFELVRHAEKAKIELSQRDHTDIHVSGIAEPISTSRHALAQASERLLGTIGGLLEDTLKDQPAPELIYTTGGAAQSPLFQQALAEWLPETPIVGGNSFDGVASGLCLTG